MYLMLFLTFLIKLLFLFSAFMSQYYRCLLPYLKVSCNFTLLFLIVVLVLEVLVAGVHVMIVGWRRWR